MTLSGSGTSARATVERWLIASIKQARRKSERRNPKSERNPNFEARMGPRWSRALLRISVSDFGFRVSGFVFMAVLDFGLAISDFERSTSIARVAVSLEIELNVADCVDERVQPRIGIVQERAAGDDEHPLRVPGAAADEAIVVGQVGF